MKKNKKSPVVASSTQPTEGLGRVTQHGASRSGRGAALKQGAAVSANAAAHGGCSTSSVSLSGAKAVPAISHPQASVVWLIINSSASSWPIESFSIAREQACTVGN